jgi:hypothetical protein
MRQVFYIEADEEMISVIGRLRKSPASENIIVAPYRSLILQSIVNLRLLSHDAHKNGKEIIVVTQDERSRSLCEKAGIRTQAVLDEEYANTNQSQYASSAPLASAPQHSSFGQSIQAQQQNQEAASQKKSTSVHLPYSDTLGSMDFFGEAAMEVAPPDPVQLPVQVFGHMQQQAPAQQIPVQREPEMPRKPSFDPLSKAQSQQPPQYDNAHQVFVRDNTPKKLTTLNSQRFEEEQFLNQQKSFTPPSLRGTPSVRTMFTLPSTPSLPVQRHNNPSENFSPQENTEHPLGFLEERRKKPTIPLPYKSVAKPPEKQVVVSAGGKMRAFFIFFGFICLLSVAGVGAYVFLPKATVHVKLKVASQQSDFEFNGTTKTIESSLDSNTIPVRIVEKDQELSRAFDSTGKSSLADKKARGSVTVYNEYSPDPQILVASTRILSQDGKVFRLLSSVTVPGMTTANGKTDPGVVEATVTADQPGQDYNLAATTFTIPGFEGSAKHDKFYAKSSAAMSGGGTSGSTVSGVASITDQDMANAKKAIETDAKKTAIDTLNQGLAAGEKILPEATDVTIVSSTGSPQVGAVTKSFDYRVKVHIKTFVFSETDLKKMTGTLLAQKSTSKDTVYSPDMIDLQYGEPTADFVAGTLRLSVHAVGHISSSLDEAQLKTDLLGQNESDIAVLLQKYTQVDTISIELWPEFLSNRIPTRPDRVTVTVEPFSSDNNK